MAKQLTQEEIIRRFRETHGDKYDYSKLIYINIFVKVCIMCTTHDEFWQTPANHLKGKGCPKCKVEKLSNDRLSNIDEFIFKAKYIHGNTYGYNNFIYKDSQTKGYVTCHTDNHGDFLISPNNHLQGKGCPVCFGCAVLTIEEFIKRAKEIHGDKYDYSKVQYINNWTKVTIICPVHGEFEQIPANHLQCKGCNNCGNVDIGNKLRSNKEEFVEKAFKAHGGKNDYSKFIYVNSWTKGCITCLVDDTHGDYWQKPASHLSGSGCPKCNYSKGESALEVIFKKHSINAEPQYKIPEVVDNFEYDFYLPEYNLLIEFQGKQHYEPIEFFGGQDNLEYNQRNDTFKKHNAFVWKYNLIEFNYKQFKHLSIEQFEELVLRKITEFNRKGSDVKIHRCK